MADSIMSKAATMEIPINSNGDTGTLPEDDSLEQVSEAARPFIKALFAFSAQFDVLSPCAHHKKQSRTKAGKASSYLTIHRPAAMYSSLTPLSASLPAGTWERCPQTMREPLPGHLRHMGLLLVISSK